MKVKPEWSPSADAQRKAAPRPSPLSRVRVLLLQLLPW